MSGTSITLDAKSFEKLQEKMLRYGTGSGQVVDEVLHGYGATRIKDEIKLLLPESRRSWSGKVLAAKNTMPFQQKNDPQAVTIFTKKQYNYLYFPDDGTNTRRHIGNKQFMAKGAENATDEIIALCEQKLIEKFEE